MLRFSTLHPGWLGPALRRIGVATIAACLASTPGATASATEGEPPVFDEAVDVRVVNIEVYVTDRKGRRVSELTRDDFRVFQDGRPVELSHFSRVGAATPAAGGSGTLESRSTPAAESRSIREPVTVVIFIDNSTLTPHHRNRVLEDVASFVVDQMSDGVRFLIATYDSSLEILTPSTADATSARQALREIAALPARGLSAISDRREALSLIRETYETYRDAGPGTAGGGPRGPFGFLDPCLAGWEKMIAAVDAYSQASGARVGNVQGALVSLTRSLGGIPGRKALLYLSDGLEQRPGLDMYAYLGEVCPQREREMVPYMTRWDETPRLEELAEYASAHRVTLYPLETTGLTNYSIASVEFDSRQFSPSTRNDTLRVSNLQSSLFILAEQTGGQAFLNTYFPAPELERMAADFNDYYSLGIVPPDGWDGETHQIRVELVGDAAKGRSLRYRQRYRAIPDEERLAERTLATLVLGWEENPLGTQVRIGEPVPAEEGAGQTVPVEIVLPAGKVGSLLKESRNTQLVRVLMIAEDAKGRRTAMREKLIPLALPQDEPMAHRSVVVDVDLVPGDHAIAIAVRDEINRVASFHRAAVTVR